MRSADPENPCIEPDMEWNGCTVSEIYSPLNYTVTLKLWLWVTQGHRKWHYSIEHIRLYSLYSSSIVTMPLSISITVSEIYM